MNDTAHAMIGVVAATAVALERIAQYASLEGLGL